MTSWRLISAPVPGTRKDVLGATLVLEKKKLSRPELLLKLENYKSVDHRLHFSGIKTGSKISFHRHFNCPREHNIALEKTISVHTNGATVQKLKKLLIGC